MGVGGGCILHSCYGGGVVMVCDGSNSRSGNDGGGWVDGGGVYII